MTTTEKILQSVGFAIQGMLIAKVLSKPTLLEDFRTYLGWAAANALRWAEFSGHRNVIEDAGREWRERGPAPVMPHEAPLPLLAPPARPEAPPQAPEAPGFYLPSRPPVFTEALVDIVQRAPVTIQEPLQRTAAEVGRLVTQEQAFAVVRSADDAVTKRAQSLLAKTLREGQTIPDATRELQAAVAEVAEQTKPWTRSYSETVVRTNLNTAYTNGRIAQMKKPWVRLVMPAMVFDAVQDTRTRPNHKACNGMVAPIDHPYIEKYRTPLGYNCRCKWSQVSWDWLRRRGLVNEDGSILVVHPRAGAGPDAGFVHAGW